jgi:hypothetical protein
VRRQDGQTALLATGITDLAIGQPAGTECFEVTVTSPARTTSTGGPHNATRTIRIYPKN